MRIKRGDCVEVSVNPALITQLRSEHQVEIANLRSQADALQIEISRLERERSRLIGVKRRMECVGLVEDESDEWLVVRLKPADVLFLADDDSLSDDELWRFLPTELNKVPKKQCKEIDS